MHITGGDQVTAVSNSTALTLPKGLNKFLRDSHSGSAQIQCPKGLCLKTVRIDGNVTGSYFTDKRLFQTEEVEVTALLNK